MTSHEHADDGDGHRGPSVLDIGGDIGALLALMDPEAEGTELHVRGDGMRGTVHTGVWTRHHAGEHVTAALFCELREGTYWVLDDGGSNWAEIVVKGGELSELDLRR